MKTTLSTLRDTNCHTHFVHGLRPPTFFYSWAPTFSLLSTARRSVALSSRASFPPLSFPLFFLQVPGVRRVFQRVRFKSSLFLPFSLVRSSGTVTDCLSVSLTFLQQHFGPPLVHQQQFTCLLWSECLYLSIFLSHSNSECGCFCSCTTSLSWRPIAKFLLPRSLPLIYSLSLSFPSLNILSALSGFSLLLSRKRRQQLSQSAAPDTRYRSVCRPLPLPLPLLLFLSFSSAILCLSVLC